MLATLVHPVTVTVAVIGLVVVTVIGLPMAPLLHISPVVIRLLPASLAVITELPQLLTIDNTGAAGVVLGAGVTALLAPLVQPFTVVLVAVTEVVVLTVIGLPLPPLLHVNSVAGVGTLP